MVSLLSGLIPRTRLVHLSSPDDELDNDGHHLLADATHGAADYGHALEVAFEWTDADRRLETCMTRYRAAVTWWRHAWHGASGPNSA